MSSKTLYKPTTTAMSTAGTTTTKSKPIYASSSSSSSSSIIALPSMSSNLFILPQAKHLDSLPVHPTLSAQRYAESEAKLKRALERNAARENLTVMKGAPQPLGGQGQLSGHQNPYPPRTSIPQPIYSEPSSPISHSPPIMMRSRQKPTC